MAATDYAGFVQALTLFQATDNTDTDFASIVPTIISSAELRCYRDLDPLAARKSNVTITLTPGTATAALPSDCWIMRELWLLNGAVRTQLEPRQPDYLSEYWPNLLVTGTPKYFSTPKEQQLLLAPTPGAGFSLIVNYTYQPTTMSASNTTTWLSTNYSDLMWSAAMVWLAGYNKAYAGEDPNAAPYWEAQYRTTLALAQLNEAQKRGLPALPTAPTPPVPLPAGS